MKRFIYCIMAVTALLFFSGCSIDDETIKASDIIETTGVKGGLVVVIGADDPALIAGLRPNDSYLVHALDVDAKKVAKAREYIQKKGVYGKVSADTYDGKNLPYVDNCVNLLVVIGNPPSRKATADKKVPAKEIERVLAPRGVAYVKGKKTVKPVPDYIDEWTHYLHGSDNNAVADDTVVGQPKHYQWIAGPRWARSHDHLASVSALVSSGGRIFYVVDEAPTAFVAIEPDWKLVARDAFSGVLLWKRDIKSWEGHLRNFRTGPAELARRLVAIDEHVYVTLGYGEPVSCLDAATGNTIQTYKETRNALEMVHNNGVLYVVVGDRAPDNTDNAAKPVDAKIWLWWPIYDEPPPGKHIVALKAVTGRVLWKKKSEDTIEMMPTTLTVSGKRAFFQSDKSIIALDAGSGKELWRALRSVNRRRPTWSAPTLVVQGDVVLSGDRSDTVRHTGDVSDREKGWIVDARGGQAPLGKIIAFSAKDGKKLWESPGKEIYNAPVDILVVDGRVWSGIMVNSRQPGITKGLDLLSGKVTRERSSDQKYFKIDMNHHRCYRNKATSKYLVLGRDGIEFIDVTTGIGYGNAWVRGTCQYGVMPCNGLIYAPSHSCACHIESKLNSFNALAPARHENVAGMGHERLQKGLAYGAVNHQSVTRDHSSSWPTYRSDVARSGKAATIVPAKLKRKWCTDLGGRLSTLTVVGDKTFVCSIDEHAVCALNTKDGKLAWRFIAGGRVDSPPSICGGMAIFGCADGWIYCVRVSDGVLAWRFRAAPEERRIVSYDQLESAWPLHGSVLIEDGAVYAVAGRTTYLDDGMRFIKLDAATGKLLADVPINDAALPDVLSFDGTSVFMRHRVFSKDGSAKTDTTKHLYSAAGFLDGDWWHRTYWMVGTRMRSGWGGWPHSGLQTPAGRILAVDGQNVYGFGRLNQYHRNGSHVGLGSMHYQLYASSLENSKAPIVDRKGEKGKPTPSVVARWSRRVDLLARAMVLSGNTLFIAGPPDVMAIAPNGVNDPYQRTSPDKLREQDDALAGKKGGLLWIVSTGDGRTLVEYKLDSPPVWDGMAAADGSLYISHMDGTITSFSDE